MSGRGEQLLRRLRELGMSEAQVAAAVLELCRRMGGLEQLLRSLSNRGGRDIQVLADDVGEPGAMLDEIAALTDADDDEPFFWDWDQCH